LGDVMVKYLRDWLASKERADLVAGLEKPCDPFAAAKPLIEEWEREMEEAAAQLEARTSTKH